MNYFQMIDWCSMPTLTVFQLYRGVFSNGMKTNNYTQKHEQQLKMYKT